MNTLDKNLRPVARTLSEANRDADYATPIWRCESETADAVRFLKEFVVTTIVIGLFVLLGWAVWQLFVS